ncbi:protein RD3-like [Lytechinus pictus]|uniref:protein RD3-like n=1 Tax=Lytechinus variegatus TaxID=7654 RepID=UPI001BB1857D|nr:protein RD3-like [Lytechinus variegatus]XP_054750715.1 protein RD3-like [Lytechinus pictus]
MTKMSLTGLFRQDPRIPAKTEGAVVRECIFNELESQMKEVQHQQWQHDQDEKQRKQTVDYSWLVSTQPKYYIIPQLQQLELEDLCSKVKACETGRIISRFRELLTRRPDVKEVPAILKAIIVQVLQERPPEETITDWMWKKTNNLTKVKQNIRVHPLASVSEQVDRQYAHTRSRRAISVPEFGNSATLRSRSLPEFCANMDSLPV